MKQKLKLHSLAIFCASLVMSSALAWPFLPAVRNKQYAVFPPKWREVLKPDPKILSGIEGESRFSTNRLGLRGDELGDPKIRILVLGGSATECGYLDDSETWPYLIQKQLSNSLAETVWVGNAGRSGHHSLHHLAQMEILLDQIKPIHLVIVMMGFNDMAAWLRRKEDTFETWQDAAVREKYTRSAFSRAPVKGFKNQLRQSLHSLRNFFNGKDHWHSEEIRTGSQYRGLRERRMKSDQILIPEEKLATLPFALKRYQQNIEQIIQIAKNHQTPLLFLTQPGLYHESMSPEETALLWFGAIQGTEDIRAPAANYARVEEMRSVLSDYNQILLKTAGMHSIETLDLDRLLPASTEIFYDDVHFHEAGAARVAQLVVQSLCDSRILSMPCRREVA
ncbi:MAG: hypothetical protein HYZ85_01385 [Candidatus Omnitrophica bacterium]|nr:hypothetical protein [Candidatus Omnitrophota bacterium]